MPVACRRPCHSSATDQLLLSCSTAGTLYGRLGFEPPTQHLGLRAVAYCAQMQGNYIVAGGGAGRLHVYDVRKAEKLSQIDAHEAPACSMHIQQQCLVTGSKDGSVKLWDVHKLTALQGEHPSGECCMQDADAAIVCSHTAMLCGDLTVVLLPLHVEECCTTF